MPAKIALLLAGQTAAAEVGAAGAGMMDEWERYLRRQSDRGLSPRAEERRKRKLSRQPPSPLYCGNDAAADSDSQCTELIADVSAEEAEEWGRDSRWYWAIWGLWHGKIDYLTDILDAREDITPLYFGIIALALRGNGELPFRLAVVSCPREGQKRPGRPRKLDRPDAEMLIAILRRGEGGQRILSAALKRDPRLPFRLVLKSTTGGRFPAGHGSRDLRLAARLAAALDEKRQLGKATRGEPGAFGQAVQAVADGAGGIGGKTVEAAYTRHSAAAREHNECLRTSRADLLRRKNQVSRYRCFVRKLVARKVGTFFRVNP